MFRLSRLECSVICICSRVLKCLFFNFVCMVCMLVWLVDLLKVMKCMFGRLLIN